MVLHNVNGTLNLFTVSMKWRDFVTPTHKTIMFLATQWENIYDNYKMSERLKVRKRIVSHSQKFFSAQISFLVTQLS